MYHNININEVYQILLWNM